jgi:triacylglycerol lipase
VKRILVGSVAALVAITFGLAANGQRDTGAGEAEAAVINPVVLVHGFTGSPSSMATLASRFQAQGRQTFSIDYNTENNVTNASQLSSYINSVKTQTGAAKVDLVVHSMGGLSSRYYLKNLGGQSSVEQFVSLGSPHYGQLAACLLPTSFGGQMCPYSSFLSSLNSGDDTPGSLLYTTIYSTNDGTVPTSSSRLDGGACFKQVSGVSHSGLTTDATVFAHVLAAVDGTCPGAFQ